MAGKAKKTGGNAKGKKNKEHNNSDNDSVDFSAILRAKKDQIARDRAGGRHSVRDAQALFEASMRGSHYQSLQTSIESLAKFKLQKTATFAQFLEVLGLRLRYSEKVRSLALPPRKEDDPPESSSFATPPNCVDLYHMIEIMDGAESILQLLFKQSSGYFQAFRPTPGSEYEKGGFFAFSNVKLPPFFGNCHMLDRPDDYTCGDQVLIGKNFLGAMTDSMVEVTKKNYKNVLNYILETPMIAFGEADRLYVILAFFAENFEAAQDTLTPELCFYYGNWSYLSKLALHIYLAIVEVMMRLHFSHATLREAWALLRKTIEQFRRCGFQLVVRDDGGYFCLARLIGSKGLLRVLKCEEDVVKKIIIRLSLGSRAAFRETRANSKGSSAPSNTPAPTSADSESDSDVDSDDEENEDEEAVVGPDILQEILQEEGENEDEFQDRLFNVMADREYLRWLKILKDGEDIMDVLMHCPEGVICSHCHR